MLTFVLGVLASLIATAIWVGLSVLKDHLQLGYLQGYWLQTIPQYEGRTCSIGRFTYDRRNRRFTWDGTNYGVDGKPMNDWKTIYFHADLENRQLIYTFQANKREEPFHPFYGFGVIYLQRTNGRKFIPTNGFFQDAEPTARPQQFTLHRMEDIMENLKMLEGSWNDDESRSEFVRKYQYIKQQKEAIPEPRP